MIVLNSLVELRSRGVVVVVERRVVVGVDAVHRLPGPRTIALHVLQLRVFRVRHSAVAGVADRSAIAPDGIAPAGREVVVLRLSRRAVVPQLAGAER